ncbi:septation ring formation regulator EzrA [Falsibacillus pallidus]|uniref:Septation ring formation regulator EzrA n=1 Tax=Falsibacillus pallidus TaxID=493781 RepID=A0A370GLX7_9BACI|nr:septation ring formation regulator EzrA [Falsibacillus pallidus]RDI44289.1 septation ring formation regulator [Falsibacillus pallidus]
MEFVIGGIVLLFILFLYGYLTKKNHFKEIDRLEEWKIDIMNRPVLEELSKVKQLNMTGQTEEMFERWRQSWDEIVGIKLPDVEELLFDAEEYADRYRFKKSKEVQEKIDHMLAGTEEKIDLILSELKDLVGSEESNRIEIDELQETYRHVKKQMLAHRHTYGKSAGALEKKVDSLTEKFNEFNELTENGDYLDAREVLLLLKGELAATEDAMGKLPELLSECQNHLPAQLAEMKEGFAEMEADGYILDHISIEKEITRMEGELQMYMAFLENAEIQEASKGIEEMKENIDSLYEALENEVHSKHFIVQNDPKTKSLLKEIAESQSVLKNDTEFVQQSYQLVEEDISIQRNIGKKLNQLMKRYEQLEIRIAENQSANSILKQEMQEIRDDLEEIQKEQKGFSEYLQNLRKDEMNAKETVADLRRQLAEASRLITKSNIPGLPSDYLSLLQEAEDNIQNVFSSLNEKPLNIKSVQEHLHKASDTVNHFYEKTEELIENVMLAERVIQYGNRYRSKYSSVAEHLRTAEAAFRSFEYRAALEQAATAVEEVEPGSLKRIENLLQQELNED